MPINKVQDLLHYLDDYFTVGPPDSLVCANNIATMIAKCEELGFTINPKKVTKPATNTNFLRVDIDSVTMEARSDPSHLSETISLLKGISGWHSATKQTILLLLAKLNFVCHVCRPGRAFLHHMIEASMKAQHLHHRIKLNKEFHWDVDWWLQWLPTWNGISLLHKSHWLTRFSQMPVIRLQLLLPGTLLSGQIPRNLLQRWAYECQLERAVWHYHGYGYQGASLQGQEDSCALW